MAELRKTVKRQILPVLPLRGIVVFPSMNLQFDVGRTKSVKALEEAMVTDQLIFLVTQKDAREDNPHETDVYRVGTISKIKQCLKLPGDTVKVLVEGVGRAEIAEFTQHDPFYSAEIVEKIFEYIDSGIETEALKRRLISTFEDYTQLSGKISAETMGSIISLENPGQLADAIAASLPIKTELKQNILVEFDPLKRLEKLLEVLCREVEILGIEKTISIRVKKQIDKVQKEYYLREQLKAIQNELGDKDAASGEIDEYREKLAEARLPEEAEKKVRKELDRLSKMMAGSAEASVIRTYLDWILELPWNKMSEEVIDLKNAMDILDNDHYGLEKVKERIIEFLAVRKMKNSLKGPILCLIGPPGVGKTSVAKSIARALNRSYVRMSLGGVKDEAEIRGHRRTYVGALPGKIITAIKQAGTKNPLILLDEIDKLSNDYRGDPASAMLEVLDGEQNYAFKDHYLEIPFDLSNVMFLTTANNADTIPRPLLDRMEIINVSGYTEEEKLNIAALHLIPKQLEMHGLQKDNLKISEQTIRDIINYYTRESGVRNLEREIAAICRKTARRLVSEGGKYVRVTPENLSSYLGTRRYRYDKSGLFDETGVATGLAWTPAGGDTLSIEVTVMSGNGRLDLTGQLGDVMKESAKAAMSYIRSHTAQYSIDPDFYNKYDIHIHIPEGAIPKDGPSAGITLATAMVSALTGIAVRKDVAMTGEITLRGRVLPVGGLKEKILAAHRAGINMVIIPDENRKDMDDIPGNIKRKLGFVFVTEMDEVLKVALSKTPIEAVSGQNPEQIPLLPPAPPAPAASSACGDTALLTGHIPDVPDIPDMPDMPDMPDIHDMPEQPQSAGTGH